MKKIILRNFQAIGAFVLIVAEDKSDIPSIIDQFRDLGVEIIE